MRTDQNNNPTAMIVQLAEQGGLVDGVDFVVGSKFPGESYLYTAKLLGDPIKLTIKVIDKVGYYTKSGLVRWTYIAIPKFIWDGLTYEQKRDVIGIHYKYEGGTEMRHLFPNYGKLR